uniref:X8 domain-containing protein n=1 Tax=Physcomitrium patens TaxID=3218 RepID=A0A7I4BLS0_PHYPA
MACRARGAWCTVVIVLLLMVAFEFVGGPGVNWGTLSINPLPPRHVVKIFDADPDVVRSMAGTDIEVMVAAPNDMLATLAKDPEASDAWVRENVTSLNFEEGVYIRWVAVGNEPFLTAYEGVYLTTTVPALRNIVNAVANAGLADTVKATIPFNADILNGAAKPSETRFKIDTGTPFSVNLYPFLSKYQSPDFPLGYAFFEGSTASVVDGPHYWEKYSVYIDALIAAPTAEGYPNMQVVLGEIGWTSDGNVFANLELAGRYNQRMINHLQSKVGTHLRPNSFTEFYLFGLLDEDIKSILPGPFERHWVSSTAFPPQMIKSLEFPPYMSAQYCVLNEEADRTNLSQNVAFACSRADSTASYPGSSCASLTPEQNASSSFNQYFQFQNQDSHACDFQGLARITTEIPSVGNCRFIIGLVQVPPPSAATSGTNYNAVSHLLVQSIWHTQHSSSRSRA